MLTPTQNTIIADQNALYYDYPIERLMRRAGQGIADVLVNKFGKGKRIAFVCGPGNNGGDGFAAAHYLGDRARSEVFLVGKAKDIRTPESQKFWRLWQGPKYETSSAREIPNQFDIVVECLLGTGIRGKLKEPFASVVKKLNRMHGAKVTIDLPAPGFKHELAISMMEKKVPGAEVVDIGYPQWLREKTGVGEVKVLHQPKPNSHKGNNGKLLIIGGSDRYHGAPLLAAKIASKIVDLVYFASVPQNNELIQKMKSLLCEFIAVPLYSHSGVLRSPPNRRGKGWTIESPESLHPDLLQAARQADAILIGPGLDPAPGCHSGATEESQPTLTNLLLQSFPSKRFILDAGAFRGLDKSLLNPNVILTPHRTEFKILFGVGASKANVLMMARKYSCVILLKGRTDYISDGVELKVNTTGNPGMTKGGTGDVLAGLTAALTCKNDPFLAARAAVFLNGLAGDRLQSKVSHYYNASDLIVAIPKTIHSCQLWKP